MKKSILKGFSLIELMVAMAVTTFIILLIVPVTVLAIDGWQKTESQINSTRIARIVFDSLVEDLEQAVIQSGSDAEWLRCEEITLNEDLGNNANRSPSVTQLTFFSTANDAYANLAAEAPNPGGDVCVIRYEMLFEDPFVNNNTTLDNNTYILQRTRINPDNTFTDVIGNSDLNAAYDTERGDRFSSVVAEGIYSLAYNFNIEYTRKKNDDDDDDEVVVAYQIVTVSQSARGRGNDASSRTTVSSVPVLRYTGIGIGSNPAAAVTAPEVGSWQAGVIKSIDVVMTIIDRQGLEPLKNTGADLTSNQSHFSEYTKTFKRTIFLPSP